MIEYLKGEVHSHIPPFITLLVNGVGYHLQVPDSGGAETGKPLSLYVHFHWNQENGPSLYGFADTLSRDVFRLIIDIPKVGPKIAMAILSQLSASAFLEAITAQDQNTLSSLHGIGEKKAEQMVMVLKDKVAKLISSGKIVAQSSARFTHWQHLSEALNSLGYSKQEINQAIAHISQGTAKTTPFDQILRAALAFLSKSP